jgi:prepilin-type N-terminal cleavage/methylation domain-containing protein
VNKTEIIHNPPADSFTPRHGKESSMKIKNIPRAGFTLVEIMIVVAIIGLLAAIAIPNFLRARSTSQQNACINNLRQIDGATQQWALQTGQTPSAPVSTSAIQPFLGDGVAGQLPYCPLSSAHSFHASYSLGTVSQAPQCLLGTDTSYLHALPTGGT